MMEDNLSNAATEAVPAIEDAPEEERKQATEEASEEAVLTQESTAVVPVSAPETGKKSSFWRRIAPVRASRGQEAEKLAAQVEALAGQLAAAEQALSGRLETIEGRIESVWEVEEQLSHLMEIQKKLDTLSRGQKTLSERAESTNRLLGVAIAGVAATAVLTGLLLASAAGLIQF